MQKHVSTFMELNYIESHGLAKDTFLSINEFEQALNCKFGIPRVEYQMMYLEFASEENNSDTYINLKDAADKLGPEIQGVNSEELFAAFQANSDDDRLTFVELWLALESIELKRSMAAGKKVNAAIL